MKAGLATNVLAVSIEADQRVFGVYKSGIFDSEKCGTNIDHAVGVVGWGIDSDTHYQHSYHARSLRLPFLHGRIRPSDL